MVHTFKSHLTSDNPTNVFLFTVLPQPLASGSLNVTAHNATNSVSGRKKRPINQSDLFIAPPFDELDAVASDGSGEPRRLTNAQLKSLRETG